jgi:hypothetical protein
MPWLLGSAALWFSGFALLLPVAPLWVIRGGSDSLGAGLVSVAMAEPGPGTAITAWPPPEPQVRDRGPRYWSHADRCTGEAWVVAAWRRR